MSCMLLPPGGGGNPCPPDCLPIGTDEMDELRHTGWRWITQQLGIDGGKSDAPVRQYLGTVRRTDGLPFYATLAAPPCEDEQPPEDWRGAFYAPFGFFRLVGTLRGRPGEENRYLLEVDAWLEAEGRSGAAMTAARWVIAGPHPKVRAPNRAALLQSIEIRSSGPHDDSDLRSCIALHAPNAVWGDPRSVVAQQCGVAAACLIEAVC